MQHLAAIERAPISAPHTVI